MKQTKRLLSLLLAFALLLACTPHVPLTAAVTDADVIYLLWYTVFPEDYPLNGADADFTGDGTVTDADVIYLLWHTVFPEDYPLEK